MMDGKDIAKSNKILRMFIGFVQRKSLDKLRECSQKDCINLLNWFSVNNIDVTKKDWYRTEDGSVIPKLIKKRGKSVKSWIWELKSMLPILLQCNGNVEFADENKKNILHVFLEYYLEYYMFHEGPFRDKAEKMVRYLMNKGISVEAADIDGNTPLHISANLGKTHFIQIMLKSCLNINARNNQEDTALHILCDKSSEWLGECPVPAIQCAESMLAKGADVNLQNKMGWTAVHLAAKNDDSCILKVLLKGKADLQLLTNDGETPLMIYCKYRTHEYNTITDDIATIELLINAGCDVNTTDSDGYSPLHYICKNYHYSLGVSLLKALVQAGVDVNAETIGGETPLLLAALWSSCEFMKYLVEKGAEISCREKIFGFTPLHMAALQFDGTKLEYLLERGLDVNDGGIYGITALHLASFGDNVECMKMLIARGADVNCQDNVTRSTPLHFVATIGSILEYISLICDVKCKPLWDPGSYYDKDSENEIALLVAHGADVNARDVHGRTPLHLATIGAEKDNNSGIWLHIDQWENIGTTEELLIRGAYTEVQDNEGNTPLHNALKTGHEQAYRSLLEFGADVNEADTSSLVLGGEKMLENWVFVYSVTLRAAQLPISDAYGFPSVDTKSQCIYLRRAAEVNSMKAFLVSETTSIYDLLHMGWRRRFNFVEKLPADLLEKFPLYGGIIQTSCREAEQRKLLLEPAKLGWYRITEVNLPDICVECILAHLKNRYLGVLAEGLSEDGS